MKAQPDQFRAWAAQQAAEWFVENRSGPLSPSRRREFSGWLGACPLHVSEYLAIARTAVDVATMAKGVDSPIAELLAEAACEGRVVVLPGQDNVELEHREPKAHRPLRRFARWRSTAAFTAAVACCLVLAMAGWLWAGYRYAEHDGHQYATRPSQDLTVKLADDTAMYLTANSAVRVRFDAHRRLVEVERGQTLFEVAHDATRPFEVHAGNTVIQDVGTVFDVSRERQQTVVTVLEGQVALWGLPADRSKSALIRPSRTDLGAGDQASILPTGVISMHRPHDLAHAAPWLKPQIVFDGETLADVAVEFNRHNREQIEISDRRVRDLPLSGVFHSYDVASFASFLNSLHGVRAAMTNGHLQVTASTDPNSSASP